jgi:hypothetical protein
VLLYSGLFGEATKQQCVLLVGRLQLLVLRLTKLDGVFFADLSGLQEWRLCPCVKTFRPICFEQPTFFVAWSA